MKNALHAKMKLLFIAIISLVFMQASNAQLLQWNTFGNTGTETIEPSVANDANISAANLTLGAGVGSASNANRFGGNNWPTTLAGAVSGNNYIQFVVTPNTGYAFTPTSLVFSWERSSTGPANATLRSSVDGFTADLGTVAAMAASVTTGNTITISGLSNITTATTFRVYGWNASATGGTGGFDTSVNSVNVVLNGTTIASYNKVSAASGDWNVGATWTPSGVPTAGQTVLIQPGHTVYTTSSLTRSTTTQVNGNFELRTGGYATGTNFTYGASAALIFQTSVDYSVANADVFWPATSGPTAVSLQQGGVTLNSMTRTLTTLNVGGTLGVNFTGGATLTVNGVCTILSNGFLGSNALIYGPSSSLTYFSGGTYGRGFEWGAAGVGTIGVTPGYPNNVNISNNTTLDYVNTGTPGAVGNKACNGNLVIAAGSTLQMNTGGVSTGGYLQVGGNFTNSGAITLGTANGDDLRVAGNFSNAATFNGNNRAVWFTKTSGTQTITASPTVTIPYIVFSATGNRTVQLAAGTNLNITAPLGGNAISFGSASDIFDINGNTLTIGTAAVANAISGAGTFTGSATSNLSLLGTGNIGTINLTGGAQTFNNFTVNRTAGAAACSIGGNLTIVSALNLTNGLVNVGNNFISIASTTTVSPAGGSAQGFVIADLVNGTAAAFRRAFTGAGAFVYPIGDVSGNFSPVTVNFPGGGTFSSAYCSAAVRAIKHPQLDAPVDFITRYWQITTSGISYPGSTTYTATGNYVDADINGTEANMIGNTWTSGWATGAPVNAAANTFAALCFPGATNQVTAGYRGADIAVFTPTFTDQANGTSYAFGAQPVGSNTDVTFTIYNYGQQPLTFGGAPVVASSTAGVFTILPGFVTTSLVVGASRTFTIRFTPAAVTPYTGSITFNTNDPDENPYVIFFNGSGIAAIPDIRIVGAGNTLTTGNTPLGFTDTLFPAQAVATTSAPKVYTIQNIGNTVLNIGTITFTGANPGDFTVSTAPSSTVAASGSTTFSVTFTPSASGTRTATVTVNSNDPDTPAYVFYVAGTGQDAEIEVYGNGVSIASGSATPTTTNNTDFGNVNVTSGTSVRFFSIFNIGTLTLNLSSVTISGANAADFSITTSAASSLASNTATMLGITFDPSASGTRTALITIVNNDADENPYTFAIRGNGVDYIPCALGANEVIVTQDFEAAPATPTWTYGVSQEAGAGVYSVTNGSAYGTTTTTLAPKFIGARSFQILGSCSSSCTASDMKITTIDFATVNTSAYQDVSLNFRLGAYSTTTTNGLDVAPEKVTVYVSTNNGATWSQEMDIAGYSNSIWVINNAISASQMYDGNNITTLYTTGATTVNTRASNYTLTNLPNSSQLKVRITFAVDRTDELWALDNVTLSGKKSASTTWQSPGTWSNGAPTSSTQAIINFPYNTASGNIDACACQINATGSMTVNANQYIDIQDNFVNNGAFTVESSGSLIQHNNAAVNSGNSVTVKRTTAPYRKFDYTYWSSPVTNAQVGTTFAGWRTDYAFQFMTSNFQDLITAATGAAPPDGFDDDGNAWLNIPTSTIMTAAKGYAIMAPTNVAFSPTAVATVTFNGPVNNGIITIPLAQSQNVAEPNDDFNLIGNPYPSALSGDAFLTLNAIASPQISGTLYFWTHNQPISNTAPGPSQYNFITADYAMYTLSGGTASGTGSAIPTGKIASGEGFFVEASNGATVATFNNSMRDKSFNNSQFFRTSSGVQIQNGDEKDRIWLNLTHANGLFSQQLIAYFPNTTLGFDPAYDGQVNLTQNSVSFYSFIGEDHYRIQARPSFDQNDIVPLGYRVLAPGHYDIAIAQTEGVLQNEGIDVFLEDRLLNVVHNLKNSSYGFDTDAGTFNERFQLRYADSALGNPEFESLDNVLIAVSNGQINVKSLNESIHSITVYDVLGREVFAKSAIGSQEFVIKDAVRSQQALIVKVSLENGATVNKKIIF